MLLHKTVAATPKSGRIARRDRLEEKARAVDSGFKAVRFGLNFALTALLLLGFCMLYVGPKDAAFYPLVLALLADAAFFAVILITAFRARRQYCEIAEETKKSHDE